jgi:hypothetical protein
MIRNPELFRLVPWLVVSFWLSSSVIPYNFVHPGVILVVGSLGTALFHGIALRQRGVVRFARWLSLALLWTIFLSFVHADALPLYVMPRSGLAELSSEKQKVVGIFSLVSFCLYGALFSVTFLRRPKTEVTIETGQA